MTIPAKFAPEAVIIPAFPDVLLNLKLPVTKVLSLFLLSSVRSASNVDTPTALFKDFTSLNEKSSTLVIVLPSWTPLIIIDSSSINWPSTSIKLNSVEFVIADLTNPTAPLLAPWIWSEDDNDVIAVPTLIFVKVFISNIRISYLVELFT